MKKKISLVITAAALVGLLAVGGTLAWFTDTEQATNTFTTGNVAIDLFENDDKIDNENEDGFAGINYDNIVPGDVEDKLVEVQNVGSVDAYIRVKVDAAFEEEFDSEFDLYELINFNVGDNGAWEQVGDYYYYKGKTAPGEKIAELFSTVSIPTTWGNEYADKSFSIQIFVDAIQAEHIYEAPASGFSATALAAAWDTKVASN